MFFGMFLATLKSFLTEKIPKLFNKSNYKNLTTEFVNKETSNQKLQQYIIPYQKPKKTNQFFLDSFLLMLRNGYNLPLLTNLLLMLNALENLISGILLSILIYFLSSIILQWGEGWLMILLLAISCIALLWVYYHFVNLFLNQLFNAIDDYLK